MAAHYGGNCDAANGVGLDVTEAAAQCDGQATCRWAIDADEFGADPFPECDKGLAVTFACGTGSGLRRLTVAAEASGRTATLGCAGPMARGGGRGEGGQALWRWDVGPPRSSAGVLALVERQRVGVIGGSDAADEEVVGTSGAGEVALGVGRPLPHRNSVGTCCVQRVAQ